MKNKGFTLVELVIVVAILSLIMLIGVPAFANIVERMKVRSDKASANEIGKAISTREVLVKDEQKVKYYPVVTRYDEIENIDEYISSDYRPQSMQDGYYFATAVKVDGHKKILVGIGKKEMPVTNTVYTSAKAAGWVYFESGKISEFLASNGSLLNEDVVMPDNYVEAEEEKKDETKNESLASLEVGDYVEYHPTSRSYSVTCENSVSTFYPENTIKWQVFSKSGGVIQLISADSVGELTLEGRKGYAEAVGILNGIANAYVDGNFVIGSRSLGSSGSSIEVIDEAKVTWSETFNKNTGLPYKDTYYRDDRAIIQENEELQINKDVWLASRSLVAFEDDSRFSVRYLPTDYKEVTHSLYIVNANDVGQSTGAKGFHVRPIVYLDSDVKIEKGEGTSQVPYELTK